MMGLNVERLSSLESPLLVMYYSCMSLHLEDTALLTLPQHALEMSTIV